MRKSVAVPFAIGWTFAGVFEGHTIYQDQDTLFLFVVDYPRASVLFDWEPVVSIEAHEGFWQLTGCSGVQYALLANLQVVASGSDELPDIELPPRGVNCPLQAVESVPLLLNILAAKNDADSKFFNALLFGDQAAVINCPNAINSAIFRLKKLESFIRSDGLWRVTGALFGRKKIAHLDQEQLVGLYRQYGLQKNGAEVSHAHLHVMFERFLALIPRPDSSRPVLPKRA